MNMKWSVGFSEVIRYLANYSVILEPDKNEADYWAGAPSVIYDNQGFFYLAARMREANSPRGRRGYEVRILKSTDGIRFHPIHHLLRDDANLPGFERPALIQDPTTNAYKLFGCAELSSGWGIWRVNDATSPEKFDIKTLHPVLESANIINDFDAKSTHHSTFHIQYKDPFIFHLNGQYHMLVIGFDRLERPYHFVSNDGEKWQLYGHNPIMENTGWHNFFTRPACLVPLSFGFLLVYEGSNINWWDPTYNIATGLAYSPDLEKYYDLTPDQPLLISTTPSKYQTWRYSHWLPIKNEMWVYFEAARPNMTNEIRCARIPLDLRRY